MKVLIATSETQGKRKNDFFWTDEGELIMPAFTHDGETVDGPCGCKRSMSGMSSHRATTTFKVLEMPLTESELTKAVEKSLVGGGWIKPGKHDGEQVRMAVNIIKDAVEPFPHGTILERRGNMYRIRSVK